MNTRIKKLIDTTKLKFGLDNYFLKRRSFSRKINFLNETEYILGMEWHPNHEIEFKDDDYNPDGTAVIELNLHTQRYEQVIFVSDISYADGIHFAEVNTDTIASWIEHETGLTYGKQFLLAQENQGEFRFHECIDGVKVYPSGFIHVNVDGSGNLTCFSIHGFYQTNEIISKDTFHLSLKKIEKLALDQLKLIKFPSSEMEKLIPLYAMEEIYVTNDGLSTIPYDFNNDRRTLMMDKPIYWEDPLHKPFERKEISLDWDVTMEQAIANEPSPDVVPISEAEQEKCTKAVTDFLRQEYSGDTGIWVLKTLYRDAGYIHATLRLNQEEPTIFHRKLTIIIDAENLQAINFIDNKPLIDHFNSIDSSEKVTVPKQEAYERIKEYFILEPYYVYDFQQQKFILCGRLDCDYGIRASNGEILLLDDL